MIRLLLGLGVVFGCLSSLVAQAPSSAELQKTIAVQRAISAGREYLRKNQASAAIQVLEAELINADGQPSYLTLLKDAYTARIRELRLAKAEPTKIEEIERRLQLLNGKDLPTLPKTPAPTNSELAQLKLPTAPPPPAIPAPPTEMYPPAPPLGPSPVVAPPTTPSNDEPPIPPSFRNERVKAPRDEAPAETAVQRASFAFQAKAYGQAVALFAEAEKNKEPLNATQQDEYAYARMHQVATKLNRGEDAPATLTALAQEVDASLRASSERLLPFGKQLLDEIRRRGGPIAKAPEVPTSEPIRPVKHAEERPLETPRGLAWQIVNGQSVRVLHMGKATLATEIATVADQARTAMYERWAGPAAGDWSPKCDIYLHPTGADYAKATQKPADHPGHSTVNIKGGQVVSRRIDLRADDPRLLDATLPHEMTQLMLSELFAEQLLPRWAMVGIAALAETPENVARYRRAVPDLLKQRKLFAVGAFMEMSGFPNADSITPFYAQSVSLVSFLVELRGPKALLAFLREAPRRGFAKALQTHYGFRDAAELQEQWIKSFMAADRE